MSNVTTANGTKKNPSTAIATVDPMLLKKGATPKDLGDGFIAIETSRPIWSPEKCGAFPIDAYLLDHVAKPPIVEDDGEVKEWSTFVLRAVSPTKAVNGDDLIEINPGEAFEMRVNADLAGLSGYARDPEKAYRVKIVPAGEKKVKKGKMRVYTKGLHPTDFLLRKEGIGYVLTAEGPTKAKIVQAELEG